ncbi:MAG: flagellar assembly peptidoglycan hydrolase FlgJ [Woeseiaceae bacterium]|nr:flagellar assembly peptidoglycan hydrolase FlgJ [Woeseiaceae bacterium]
MTAAITDLHQFAELRRGADNRDPAVLREVASQFEAIFLQTMLKSMRDASIGDPIFGDSNSHEMYRDMLDKQLSLEMASGEGIGLADMLVRQLGGADAAPRPGPAVGTGEAVAVPRVQRSSPTQKPDAPVAWTDPASFVRDVWPHAQRVAEQLDVSPEAVLAQAALETGWGKHVIPARDGSNSHNLFGIKAGSSWDGDSVARRTLEFDGDVPRHETAKFRAYASVGDTFDDYVEFLTTNPRYAEVKGHGNDIDGFAGALQSAGYATDPAYAEKISRVATSDTMQRALAPLKSADAAPITP